MSKRDEALRMLREGVDLKVIEARTSRGTLYNAFNDFFMEADAKRKKTAEELENLEAKHKKTSAAVAGLERSEEEKRNAVEELELKAEKLGRDVKAAEEKLGDLQQTLSKYREDGVTEKTFKVLSRVKISDEEEFIERVKTYEAAQKLKDETVVAQQSLLICIGQEKSLQETISKLEEEASDLDLLLDEKKRRNVAWDDQLTLVEDLVKSGYTTDVLRSVKLALDTHAIKKDPELTVKRLAEGAAEYKELVQLKRELKSTETTLKNTNANLEQAEAGLKALETNLIKSVNRARDRGITELDGAASKLKAKLENMVYTINEMEKTFFGQQLTIAEVKTNEAKAKFEELGETWNKVLQATLFDLDATLKSYQHQVLAWGDAKEKLVTEQEVYNYGTIIMQTFRDPDSLRKVPQRRIASIAGVVHAWIEMSVPNIKVKPSREINQIEENLLYYREFSLKALAKLLFDALTPQLI